MASCFTGVGHITRDAETLLQASHLSEQLQPSSQHIVHSSISKVENSMLLEF